MEQIILETVSKHVMNQKVIWDLHGFAREKLMSFSHSSSQSSHCRSALDTVCPNSNKALDTVSYNIITDNLKYRLIKGTVR